MKTGKQGGLASCSLLQLASQLLRNLRQRRMTRNCCLVQNNIGVIFVTLGNLNAVVYEVIAWQVDWLFTLQREKGNPEEGAGKILRSLIIHNFYVIELFRY